LMAVASVIGTALLWLPTGRILRLFRALGKSPIPHFADRYFGIL